MTFEFVQGNAATIWIEADLPTYPVSATVYLYQPGGSALVTSGSATVDGVNTTIASKTSDEVFGLTSAASVVVGRRYFLAGADGGQSGVLVSDLDGTTATLAEPPTFSVAVGDVFRGLRVSYTIASTYLDTRDTNYRAEWRIVDGDSTEHRFVTPFHVVRQQFQAPMTAERARAYVSINYGSVSWSQAKYEDIARRAAERVRRAIQQTGRYPHLFGDSAAFEDAGMFALRFLLVDESLFPGDVDEVREHQRDMDLAMVREVGSAVQALNWYDANDDGAVGSNERGPWSIRIVL